MTNIESRVNLVLLTHVWLTGRRAAKKGAYFLINWTDCVLTCDADAGLRNEDIHLCCARSRSDLLIEVYPRRNAILYVPMCLSTLMLHAYIARRGVKQI